jgi:hypothetical protein
MARVIKQFTLNYKNEIFFQKSTQIFTEKSLESCRRCLIVHDLDASVKTSDINKIIAKALNTNTIKFHVHFSESQCKYYM